jgi:tight adherence protein B
MNETVLLLFLGSVFLTVFLLSQVLILPTFGTDSANRKKLKTRFDKLLSTKNSTHHQLIKKRYLEQLSPLARGIESLAPMMDLKALLESAGRDTPAYRFVLINGFICLVIAFAVLRYTHDIRFAAAALAIAFYLPFLWLKKKRSKNLELFEEQLPEALEMMARSLRTGYPFTECLKIVAEEMPPPIGKEFGLVFEEVNYGRDLEVAFALMMERMPCLSLSAMATSVLIQKETGGNMAEILLKISQVMRGRFKLKRRVKTLSAEGVFSAWVLCLMPFFMFAALSMINPDHFKALYEHPNGMMLFYVIAFLEVVAVFWMRKIIHIDA